MNIFIRALAICLIVIAPALFGVSWTVNSTSDDPAMGDNTTMYNGTLPFCILNASSGDTIDASFLGNMTLTLTQSLPALTGLTILNTSGMAATVDGQGMFQGFSVASGNNSISNFQMVNCVSIGGAGGSGNVGGGGGGAGGGGLYVHSGVHLNIDTMAFMGDQAIGGAGGAGSGASSGGGGGGGGFGGGAGGNNGGGGGGGFTNGGAGGTASAGANGNFFGGGGGGAAASSGGSANTSGGGTTPTPKNVGGISSGTFGGGGGAGAGGSGSNATTTTGANGGPGIGSDLNFGGGGGGGGGVSGNGGAGLGGGGGGGSAAGGALGGAGGAIGGGGGGGVGATGGGAGTFGGGGGASGSGTGGTSLFGGGTGGVGSGSGGGGGAALGGAIFVGNAASLSVSGTMAISGGGSVTAGAAGSGGTAGQALGPDIFLQSGGAINFNLTVAGLTISSNIDSDQGAGGGTGGGITTQGTETLTLSGNNTYTGGTTLISGALSVPSDAALGASSEALTLFNGTFETTGPFTSARPITLGGAGVIDTMGNNMTLSGIISGGGALDVTTSTTGATVTLTGANTYTGGTIVGPEMTLIGSTSSIPSSGNVTLQSMGGNGSTLTFLQTASGTFSASISGDAFTTLNLQGTGTLQMTGDSSGFLGALNVLPSVTFQADGSFANAALTISSGAGLSGTGTVGSVNNSGTISPGDSGIGTLTVNGTLTLQNSSVLNIEIAPQNVGDLLQVNGTAALNGAVNFFPVSGFYGFSAEYSFLKSTNLMMTTFSSFAFSSPYFSGSILYTATDAILNLIIEEPFLNFPFTSANRRHVGNYLDALNVAGVINPELVAIVNSMAGFNNFQINDALDQMHPAIYSALIGGLQPSVGGQILSLFHRYPTLPCGCSKDTWRFWTVPMGNWLREGNLGEQTAYEAQTRGVVAGCDRTLGENWVFGLGAAWNECSLIWERNRGKGHVHKYLGALYTDYMSDVFYCGVSAYAGVDDNNIFRQINFSTNDLTANGHFNSFDFGSQFSSAYLFRAPYFLLYPYANFDFFYFQAPKFLETGGGALNLDIQSHTSSTVRGEAGIGIQVQDTNLDETICIEPAFTLGWAMECPISRPAYQARFQGEPFGFEAKGWDHTFQLFTVDASLKITLYNFSFSGEYRSEIAPAGRDNFWDQRCNLELEYVW